jgi:hypothetical protein
MGCVAPGEKIILERKNWCFGFNAPGCTSETNLLKL